MKKLIFGLGFAALTMAPLAVRADDDSPLHKQMEATNDAFKAFRKETDPAKGAALARDAQASAIKSLSETPELVAQIKDPVEKAKAEVAYKKMIANLVVTLCDVEEAFQAGKLDEVAKLVDAIKEQKKTGHEKFIPEDK
jgi:soluble cytochrome b562